MGSGRWNPDDWKKTTKTRGYDSKKTSEIYKSRSLNSDLDVKDKIRESFDSDDNPNSTPIILALDVTGSMGGVCDKIARNGLNKLITEILERKPVKDPHICIAGIGDVKYDSTPFQATQFEADIRLIDQLENIYLEMGGGGNQIESYSLAWWFAAKRTSTDSFRKRGKKGYIFTFGDEWPDPMLSGYEIQRVFGGDKPESITNSELLNLVSREWEVYHLVVVEGSYGDKPLYSKDYGGKVSGWSEILGERAIRLTDHTKLPEVIVSLIQVNEGLNTVDEVVDSWDKSTSLVVKESISSLKPTSGNGGIVKL